MNKQMVKKAAAFGIVAVLSVGAVFAKPHQSNSKDWKHHNDAGAAERPMPYDGKSGEFNERQMQPDGKGGEFNRRPMMNDAAAQTGNSVMGKWIARDENKAVKVEFDRDGSMEIEWLQGFTSSTEWEGFWTATDTEVTFTVRSKETETWTNGSKKEIRESMNAVWKLQYTRNDDNTLTLTGSDLPKELANLTLSRQGR
ncbi:hypothetical protein ABK01_01855 [Treponema sp. OMZ 305]|uniref:hypothetical protein n=1 Tax=Treponema sp. OMZ 305 TaxID=1659192 RepID=UPI0020A4CAD0|nr:hypothetical protein [Treponema sp. OMZ 305]UTC57130.1 hypothetical protein ABK01_01855 [Treponema sp. OMZ 305]